MTGYAWAAIGVIAAGGAVLAADVLAGDRIRIAIAVRRYRRDMGTPPRGRRPARGRDRRGQAAAPRMLRRRRRRMSTRGDEPPAGAREADNATPAGLHAG